MSFADPDRAVRNCSVRSVDQVEALNHLDPDKALSGLHLEDHEGFAIRAALDAGELSPDWPKVGNAAIRAALRQH